MTTCLIRAGKAIESPSIAPLTDYCGGSQQLGARQSGCLPKTTCRSATSHGSREHYGGGFPAHRQCFNGDRARSGDSRIQEKTTARRSTGHFLGPVVAQIDAVMLSAQSRSPNAARLFVDFILSKEGQSGLAGVQQIPVRRDMEPRSKPVFQGHQWFVERPDKHENFTETVKLFREIFGSR